MSSIAEQIHAGPDLLRHFPPLLLIVGGTEILMAENLQLAQKAQVRTSKNQHRLVLYHRLPLLV